MPVKEEKPWTETIEKYCRILNKHGMHASALQFSQSGNLPECINLLYRMQDFLEGMEFAAANTVDDHKIRELYSLLYRETDHAIRNLEVARAVRRNILK